MLASFQALFASFAYHFRRKRPERSDSNDSLSSTLQVPTPSVHELVLRKATNERIEELKRLMKNERAKYKKISQTLQQVITKTELSFDFLALGVAFCFFFFFFFFLVKFRP